MANPYIQNFINLRQQENIIPVAQNVELIEERKKDFFKTNIRPDSPKGYIVKENALQAAGSSVTGLAKTGVYFVNALNGKGTDYTVGRINDGARFLGSLGIAAALASTAKNPKAKMMEFVGFATWFASMSLWPKMLGTAIKATKGVDINQQYVDSYGRKKGFFEDAQYITWDLYKDKDLYKMGDKLGVPKNIENRKDAIKEKAKQVATQGNTLMMLTAGFATPIATALICNTLESPVSKAIETYQLRKAEKSLEKLSTEGLMSGSEKGLVQLGKIIGEGDTVKLDVNEARQVRNLFKQFEGTGLGVGVEKELNKYASPVIQLDQKAKDGFRKAIIPGDDVLKTFAGESEETFTILKNALTIKPERFERKVIKGRKTLEHNIDSIEGSARRLLDRRLGAAERLLRRKGISAKLNVESFKDGIVENLAKEADNHKIISAPRKFLEDLFKFADDFKERKIVADLLKKVTIGDVADSQTAKHWEDAPRKILKDLGVDEKTVKLVAGDPISAPKYIEQHLKELTKPGNEEKLNKAAEKIAKTAKNVIGRERKAAAKLIRAWRKIGRTIEKSSTGSPAFDTARRDAVRLEIANVRNKVMGTQSSFYKALLVLDRLKDPKTSEQAARELRSGLGVDFWSNKGEHLGIKNTKRFGQIVDEMIAPLQNILQGDKGLRAKFKAFHHSIKMPLGQIDGANRGFYLKDYQLGRMYQLKELKTKLLETVNDNKKRIIERNIAKIEKIIGKINSNLKTLNSEKLKIRTLERSDAATGVGKSFIGFIRDAAIGQGIKNTWLKKVLFVAVPVVGVSLLAISQFGKKNKYNPDVYIEKGSK